jgi:hypothetical protein
MLSYQSGLVNVKQVTIAKNIDAYYNPHIRLWRFSGKKPVFATPSRGIASTGFRGCEHRVEFQISEQILMHFLCEGGKRADAR